MVGKLGNDTEATLSGYIMGLLVNMKMIPRAWEGMGESKSKKGRKLPRSREDLQGFWYRR